MARLTVTGKMLNVLLAPSSGGRKRPDQAWRKAVSSVVRSTGCDVGADQVFVDELGFLLECTADEADLTPLGWASALTDAKMRLANRLRVSRVLAERPEVARERIAAPVFVVGLPRTATTLAHKILAVSADHRSPLLWEMYNTGLDTGPGARRKFVKEMEQRAKAMTRLAPSFQFIHPISAAGPEESMCVLPHGTYHAILKGGLRSYRSWFAGRDVTGDYEYLKETLQVLQHGREPKRWMLKYPAHLNELETIRRVFPDATFVWTHRDPTTVVGSLCSLMESSWSLYQRRPDLDLIGELAVELLVESVEKGRDARAGLPVGAIVDVPYHRLSSDPHHEVPRLYEAIGAKWTGSDADNLDAVLARPSTDRKHEYSIGRYGLELGEVEAAFGDYMSVVAGLNK